MQIKHLCLSTHYTCMNYNNFGNREILYSVSICPVEDASFFNTKTRLILFVIKNNDYKYKKPLSELNHCGRWEYSKWR